MLTMLVIAGFIVTMFAISALIGGTQHVESEDGYVEFAQTPFAERADSKVLVNA